MLGRFHERYATEAMALRPQWALVGIEKDHPKAFETAWKAMNRPERKKAGKVIPSVPIYTPAMTGQQRFNAARAAEAVKARAEQPLQKRLIEIIKKLASRFGWGEVSQEHPSAAAQSAPTPPAPKPSRPKPEPDDPDDYEPPGMSGP